MSDLKPGDLFTVSFGHIWYVLRIVDSRASLVCLKQGHNGGWSRGGTLTTHVDKQGNWQPTDYQLTDEDRELIVRTLVAEATS